MKCKIIKVSNEHFQILWTDNKLPYTMCPAKTCLVNGYDHIRAWSEKSVILWFLIQPNMYFENFPTISVLTK